MVGRRRRPGACPLPGPRTPTCARSGSKRAAPAARPEGRDRRQRHQRRAERQDRAVGGEIVGGRAGGRRDEHAVGDQFVEPHLAVDVIASLAAWEVWRSSETSLMARAVVRPPLTSVARMSSGWMIEGCAAARRSRRSALGIFVHQEADRAAVHAVDRLGRAHGAMQGLQHQTVAAERDDDVGLARADSRRSGRQDCPARRRLPARRRTGS